MPVAPFEFSQAIADEICERLSRGESLRKICGVDRDDFLPGQTTVFRWLSENDGFVKQYARARELQAEHYVDEIVEIADAPNATIDVETGAPVLSDPQRDRLRIDARKWVASKLAPKKYGDKLAHVGGDDSDQPIQHNVSVKFVKADG
jgi:hypothetical protein